MTFASSVELEASSFAATTSNEEVVIQPMPSPSSDFTSAVISSPPFA